jgi:hypothetical protein
MCSATATVQNEPTGARAGPDAPDGPFDDRAALLAGDRATRRRVCGDVQECAALCSAEAGMQNEPTAPVVGRAGRAGRAARGAAFGRTGRAGRDLSTAVVPRSGGVDVQRCAGMCSAIGK